MEKKKKLYEVGFQEMDGSWGSTLVRANNKEAAERKARRQGVKGVKRVKKWGKATLRH